MQAFEPPLDMSIDIDEDEHLENTAEHYHPEIPRSSERSNWSRHSESITESNSLIPEPSTFRGENSLPRDDMRSDDKVLYLEPYITIKGKMNILVLFRFSP